MVVKALISILVLTWLLVGYLGYKLYTIENVLDNLAEQTGDIVQDIGKRLNALEGKGKGKGK